MEHINLAMLCIDTRAILFYFSSVLELYTFVTDKESDYSGQEL